MRPRELLTKRLEDDLALLGPNLDLMLAVLSEVLADPAMRAQYYQRMVMTGITGVVEHLDACQQRGETNIPNISMAARIFVSAMLGLKLLNILGNTTVRDASKKKRTISRIHGSGAFRFLATSTVNFMTNDFTVTFTQPAALETVGGKGLNLMRLTRVGMPVPSALLFRRRFTELL